MRLVMVLAVVLIGLAALRAPAPVTSAMAAKWLTAHAGDVALLSWARDLPDDMGELADRLLNADAQVDSERAEAGVSGIVAEQIEVAQVCPACCPLPAACAQAPPSGVASRASPGFPDPLLRPPRLA